MLWIFCPDKPDAVWVVKILPERAMRELFSNPHEHTEPACNAFIVTFAIGV